MALIGMPAKGKDEGHSLLDEAGIVCAPQIGNSVCKNKPLRRCAAMIEVAQNGRSLSADQKGSAIRGLRD
jgi:hypothetical protein